MVIELTVQPQPGPVPARRPRRRRWIIAGIVLLSVAGVLVALAATDEPRRAEGPEGWVDALVDGPPRGALGADGSFAGALTDGVTEILRADGYIPVPLLAVDQREHPEQEVRLLFADDVEDQRIALLALRLPSEPDPASSHAGRTKVIWLAGPRAATAHALLSVLTARPMPGVFAGSVPAAPVPVAVVGPDRAGADIYPSGCLRGSACALVAVTPPGCAISTAPVTDLSEFRAEPTGSFLVRTAVTYRAEYWRVTCDGVVRQERPAPPLWQRSPPSGEEVDAALAGAGFLVPAELVTEEVYEGMSLCLNALESTFGGGLLGPARLVWAGSPTGLGTAGLDGPPLAMVMVAPSVRSTWVGVLSVRRRLPNGPDVGESVVFRVGTDPTATDALLAVAVTVPRTMQEVAAGDNWEFVRWVVLVVAPAATTVRLVDPDGPTSMESVVVGGAAVLSVPDGAEPATLHVAADDADGSLLGTTVIATAGSRSFEIDNWN